MDDQIVYPYPGSVPRLANARSAQALASNNYPIIHRAIVYPLKHLPARRPALTTLGT
jgi:hypothetical protein